MAETNIQTAIALYSAKFIEGLVRALPVLRSFSLDCSDDLLKPGKTLDVSLVEPDAVGNWNSTTNNYGRTKKDPKAIQVTIDKRKITGFAIDQAMLANFNPTAWEGKAELNVMELADTIAADVISVVTKANFGDAAKDKIAIPLAGFNRLAIAQIRAHIVKNKMRPTRCTLALNPDYFAALLGDLDANVYGGREAIMNGAIPGLFGFRSICEVPQMDIPGFINQPDSVAMGSRKVPVADTTPYKEFGSMKEPVTGLTVNKVVYTNGAAGETSFSVECLYGYAPGNANALVRIV